MKLSLQTIGDELYGLSQHAFAPHLAVLIILLLVAATVDIRERRIPNWLVLVGMTVGLVFHTGAQQGSGSGFALAGGALGIVVLFPLFAFKVLGAGDVKLIGMTGIFLGMSGIVGVILASMAAGGVLALGMAASRRVLPELLSNVRLMVIQNHIRRMSGAPASFLPKLPSVGKMPYAVAILAGTVIQLFVLRY